MPIHSKALPSLNEPKTPLKYRVFDTNLTLTARGVAPEAVSKVPSIFFTVNVARIRIAGTPLMDLSGNRSWPGTQVFTQWAAIVLSKHGCVLVQREVEAAAYSKIPLLTGRHRSAPETVRSPPRAHEIGRASC